MVQSINHITALRRPFEDWVGRDLNFSVCHSGIGDGIHLSQSMGALQMSGPLGEQLLRTGFLSCVLMFCPCFRAGFTKAMI